jgi:hypothetical protein
MQHRSIYCTILIVRKGTEILYLPNSLSEVPAPRPSSGANVAMLSLLSEFTVYSSSANYKRRENSHKQIPGLSPKRLSKAKLQWRVASGILEVCGVC